jgi:site-specific DNA-cytosine methylase
MRIWDICCGTKSVSNVWKENGHETLTLDIEPNCMPDICTDIMSWEYTDFSLEPPDFIWCSPPCTHYSIARTNAKTPRDLEGSDKIVQKCLDIIHYWRPKYWVIENPQTGLLKTRAVVQGLNFKDVDYCMYGAPYRKRTRLWTNCTWTPSKRCEHGRSGHPSQVSDFTLATRNSIPAPLIRELMDHCVNETQEN